MVIDTDGTRIPLPEFIKRIFPAITKQQPMRFPHFMAVENGATISGVVTDTFIRKEGFLGEITITITEPMKSYTGMVE